MIGVADLVSGQQKVIRKQGDLLKSLSERIEKVEQTPVGRQSLSTAAQARQLQRGFGPTNQPDGLSKGERLAGLTKMNLESKTGRDPVTGVDLMWTIAAVEGNKPLPGNISEALDNEIRKALGK